MADNLTSFKEKHPQMTHREAFAAVRRQCFSSLLTITHTSLDSSSDQVAKQWADAPENPNKGQ
jgi:hypothetical protein